MLNYSSALKNEIKNLEKQVFILQEIISRQLQTGIFKEPTKVYVEKMADKERVEAELKLLKGVVKSYKKNKLQSEAENVKFQQFN